MTRHHPIALCHDAVKSEKKEKCLLCFLVINVAIVAIVAIVLYIFWLRRDEKGEKAFRIVRKCYFNEHGDFLKLIINSNIIHVSHS